MRCKLRDAAYIGLQTPAAFYTDMVLLVVAVAIVALLYWTKG